MYLYMNLPFLLLNVAQNRNGTVFNDIYKVGLISRFNQNIYVKRNNAFTSIIGREKSLILMHANSKKKI